jgi:hypothetical protein
MLDARAGLSYEASGQQRRQKDDGDLPERVEQIFK